MTSPGTSSEPHDGFEIRIDGRRPLSAETVTAVHALCDRVEGSASPRPAVVQVTGAPDPAAPRVVALALVNKWERALRRLERLEVATVAVATGDCGGIALEALLATDYRLATDTVRLLVPAGPSEVWPGMGLYRLANQIGVNGTRRSVLFGAPIPATEALTLRLVDELVHSPAEGVTQAIALLGPFTGAGLAVRRQLMLDATTTSFEDALGRHLAACDRLLRQGASEVLS